MAGLALVAAAVIYAAPQASGYHIIKRMPIGGEGGWDYMTVDSDTHRLYIARGSHFQVVDDTTGKVIGDIEIANTKNSHGLTLALDMGKGFTSNGDANTVSVVDLKTLKATSVIPSPAKILIRFVTMPPPSVSSPLTARARIRPSLMLQAEKLLAQSSSAENRKRPSSTETETCGSISRTRA